MATVADFAPLVSGSHTARFRCRVVSGFPTGEDPVGDDLRVVDGTVSFDATAEVRAAGEITVVEPWPGARDLSLAPFGTEVFLARGVDRGGDGILWAPLGYFRITATGQGDAARGPLSLTLDDRMATIIDSRFMEARQWAQGTQVGDIVNEIVTEVYPNAVITWDDNSDTFTLGRTLIADEQSSRYDILLDLADGLGKLVFWDTTGELVFIDAPDEETVDWDVRANENGGVMVNADRSLTRIGIYNAVVATGDGLDDLPPVRAVATNSQSNSPTRFGGPFGRIPRFYNSPFITTQEQANGAAESILRRSLGAQYDVNFSSVPNPALKPRDVVRLTYNDGNREVHIIETVEIPFNVETPLSATTRQSTVVFVSVML